MKKVTPYELATLAARISPGRCTEEPQNAVLDAMDLLNAAENLISADEKAAANRDEMLLERSVNWAKGIKKITKQTRRDRAEHWFRRFMDGADTSVYKRDGFTRLDVHELAPRFAEWMEKPKRRKSKQGRRISKHDGRLRTELVGLVPTKPPKRA